MLSIRLFEGVGKEGRREWGAWVSVAWDKQQGRCVRYYLLDNQNVCWVSRMMNIQPSVKLIIFIYQQESLLCCSMSIGYWCNIKWVLFSYMSVDFSHTPPKKQQQQKQETDGGWSEHWGHKWWEGLSRSAHFCSDRQVGTHRCLPCKVTLRAAVSCSGICTTQTTRARPEGWWLRARTSQKPPLWGGQWGRLPDI